MDPARQRLVFVIVVALLAVLAVFVAWWLVPSADDADGADDTVWAYRPVRGVRVPDLPPPGKSRRPGPDGSDTDGISDRALDIADAVGAWLDPDAPEVDSDGEAVERTEDGWRLLAPEPTWRDAVPPGEGQVVAMALLPDGTVLAESRRDDGSVVLLRAADATTPPRVLTLEGIAEPSLAAAHARSPALTDRGPVVLAEDATGRTRVWSVDLAAGSATPTTREGLDRPGAAGPDLDHLAASGAFVAASWRGSGVAVRRIDGAAGWLIFDEGPSGIDAIDVGTVGAQARLAYTRGGRLLELVPGRTVPDTLVASGARDPVLLADQVLWVVGSRIEGSPVVRPQSLRALLGRDLVRGAEGRSAAWVGGDGRVRVIPDGAAVDVGLGRITAIAVALDGSTTVLAVAGRRGAVAEVVVLRL